MDLSGGRLRCEHYDEFRHSTRTRSSSNFVASTHRPAGQIRAQSERQWINDPRQSSAHPAPQFAYLRRCQLCGYQEGLTCTGPVKLKLALWSETSRNARLTDTRDTDWPLDRTRAPSANRDGARVINGRKYLYIRARDTLAS